MLAHKPKEPRVRVNRCILLSLHNKRARPTCLDETEPSSSTTTTLPLVTYGQTTSKHSKQEMDSPSYHQLQWPDYLVFVLMLVVSILIGIYYRMTGGKQNTTAEYLLADGSMSIFPVAFSLMASFMSAITLLGVSSEIYTHGATFVLINLSYIIGTPIAAFVFLPVFYELKLTSVYQVTVPQESIVVSCLISCSCLLSTVSRTSFQSLDTPPSLNHLHASNDLLHGHCFVCTRSGVECRHGNIEMDVHSVRGFGLYSLLHHRRHEGCPLD